MHHRDFYMCYLVCNEPFSINMVLTPRPWQPPPALCDPSLLGRSLLLSSCRCWPPAPGRPYDVTRGAKEGTAQNRAQRSLGIQETRVRNLPETVGPKPCAESQGCEALSI